MNRSTFFLISLFVVVRGGFVYGQYNFSTQEKYLPSPYSAEDMQGHDEVLMNRSKNRPTPYRTMPQDGFVMLLDSTVIYGKIELFGRCFGDHFGVVIRSSDSLSTKLIKREQVHTLSLSSLISYGLLDRSVNDTPDEFTWEEMFPVLHDQKYFRVENDVWTDAYIDTAAYNEYTGKIFGARYDDSRSRLIDNNIYQRYQNFYPHVCERSELAPGYIVKNDGQRLEGFIQLERVDGVVIRVNLQTSFRQGVGNTVYKPKDLRSYGVSGDIEREGNLNETPSAFNWGIRIPNSKVQSTRKEAGYVLLKDGSRLTGDLQIRAEDDKAVAIEIKNQGEKAKVFALETLLAFGLDGYPKDESVNDTPDAFSWSVFTSLNPLSGGSSGEPNNSKEESRAQQGYVITKSGEKFEGSLQLIREYGFVNQVTIKPPKGKKMEFVPSDVTNYGSSEVPVQTNVGLASRQSLVTSGSDLDSDTMRPSSNNPWNPNLESVPVANNTAVNESSEEYFEWQLVSGTPGKQTERSATKPGYVKLKSGDKMEGDLTIKRQNTKLEKYILTEFEVVNNNGKNKYSQEEVSAYGVSQGDKPKIGPGDKIMGLVVEKDPKLIIYPKVTGYSTEFKSGFVQLMSGEVKVGMLSEETNLSGRAVLTLVELDGTETKFKGDQLAFGYFEVKPFNEFPSSAYAVQNTGYLRLIDGSIVDGRFRSGIPGTGNTGMVDESEGSGDPCSAPPPPREVPPMNKFFDEMREQKLAMTDNSELIKDIFDFRIVTDEGMKKYRNDLVLSFGLDGVLMSDINKNGLVVHEDNQLNFHRGRLETTKGEKKEGWVARIPGLSEGEYYGVYFTSDENTPVVVFRSEQLKSATQDMVEIEEFDPLSEDFLTAKDMNSTFDSYSNGLVVDMDGNEKRGNITVQFPQKLWYGTSIILTDANGAQTIYDKDFPIDRAEFTEGDVKRKFIMYQGVFVEVIREEQPFYYFRNPNPSVQTNTSKFLNKMMDDLVQKGQNELAGKLAQSGQYDMAFDLVQRDLSGVVDVAMYMEEYLVYNRDWERGYIALRKDLGHYTNYAEFEDLKNGCVRYLELDKNGVKALGDINDYKTGEGIEPSLKFLHNCYYPQN